MLSFFSFRNLAEIEIKREVSKSNAKNKTLFYSWFSTETPVETETPQLIRMLTPEQRRELENSLQTDTENVVSNSAMSEQVRKKQN